MKKVPKDQLKITTYWYENSDGYIVIDKKAMRDEFKFKLEQLEKSTKLGYKKHMRELFKNKK
tara:strand:+ start:2262 stop:2447 length:186 start_codon:yes stop_codon:yes gene_type:complete